MRLLKLPFILILVVILITISINIFEEELDPKITPILESYNNLDIQDDNALLYILGMRGDKNRNPINIGHTVFKQYKENINETNDSSIFDVSSISIANSLSLDTAKIESFNGKTDLLELIDVMNANKENYIQSIKDNSVLLARYENLLKYKTYNDIRDLLWPNGLLSLKRLYILQMVLLWEDKKYKKVIDQLNMDLKFWRMVHSKNLNLLHRLLASLQLQKSYDFLSYLITKCHRCVEDAGFKMANFSPLTTNEMRIDDVFMREFSGNANVMNDLHYVVTEKNFKDDKNFGHFIVAKFALIFFRKNHTINEMFNKYTKLIILGKTNVNNYNLAREKYIKEVSKGTPFYNYFYNPVGKYINDSGSLEIVANYNRAIYEVEINRKLLYLKINIYKKNIKTEKIPAYLKENPVTIEYSNSKIPIQWSVEDKTMKVILHKDLGSYSLSL